MKPIMKIREGVEADGDRNRELIQECFTDEEQQRLTSEWAKLNPNEQKFKLRNIRKYLRAINISKSSTTRLIRKMKKQQ